MTMRQFDDDDDDSLFKQRAVELRVLLFFVLRFVIYLLYVCSAK